MTLNDYQESVFDDRPTLLQAFKGLKDFVDKTNTENDGKFANINNKIDEQVATINNQIEAVNNRVTTNTNDIASIRDEISVINTYPKTVVYEKQNLGTTQTKLYQPINYSQDKNYVVTIYIVQSSWSGGTVPLTDSICLFETNGNISVTCAIIPEGFSQYNIGYVSKKADGIEVGTTNQDPYSDTTIVVKIDEV